MTSDAYAALRDDLIGQIVFQHLINSLDEMEVRGAAKTILCLNTLLKVVVGALAGTEGTQMVAAMGDCVCSFLAQAVDHPVIGPLVAEISRQANEQAQ